MPADEGGLASWLSVRSVPQTGAVTAARSFHGARGAWMATCCAQSRRRNASTSSRASPLATSRCCSTGSCGALYGLMAPWHDLRSSANAYHSARIVMKGSAVEYWIDDEQVIGCDLASEELRARIARSRFRDYPQFARLTKGHIVLQHRGTEAWFRRLRIELTPA